MSAGTIVNAGTVAGGNGGASQAFVGMNPNIGAPGSGGVGIIGSNLTIINSGTISGGFANGGGGPQNYAVQLNGGTNYVGPGGTISGGIYVAGGLLQPALPGSAVGTPLAVGGTIAFAPGTFYNVRIAPAASDSIVATGAGTLTGAGVAVNAGAGTYQAHRYTILTAAGGLGGTTFSGVTSDLVFFFLRRASPTTPTTST